MATPWILALVAMVAAAISAATGVAGGLVLLAALAVLMPAAAVVPLHGAVQLMAGTTRAWVFRRHVDRRFVRDFALGLVPGSALGAGLVWWLRGFDPAWLRVALGTAILLSLIPRRAGPSAVSVGDWSSPLLVPVFGLLCGALGMVVGSTGPLVSRGLLAYGLLKERHVGTKAWAQSLAHLLKIPLFGLALDFDFGEYGVLIAVLGGAVIVGTIGGRRLLAGVSDERFGRMTRVLLGVLALQLLGRELWGLMGG